MSESRFLTLDDLSNLPTPQWMIDGMFERGALVMVAGPSYSFKSFILLDWLLCIASGRQWLGRVTQTGKIVYALGEGKSSLMKRIQAWMNHNKPTPEEMERLRENFRVTFDVVQLASKASTDNLLADMEAVGFKPDYIAIDTFARSMVGMDENDAKDSGLWVDSADRLRQLGFGVIFVHHTKKNTEMGVQYRGSSAIIGAMDTAMTLIREADTATLKITKQKDHDEGKPMKFRRVMVPVGKDHSCVMVPLGAVIDERFSGEPKVNKLTPEEQRELIMSLIHNSDFSSDTERADVLVSEIGGTVGSAKVRISNVRTRK